MADLPPQLVEAFIHTLRELNAAHIEGNALMREQNALLARIAFAAEEANRNNPLAQLDRIMAAAAPEENVR